jgi:hypothetical protein
MYEMEGPRPACRAVACRSLGCLALRGLPPIPGYPREVPVARSFPRSGVSPGW